MCKLQHSFRKHQLSSYWETSFTTQIGPFDYPCLGLIGGSLSMAADFSVVLAIRLKQGDMNVDGWYSANHHCHQRA